MTQISPSSWLSLCFTLLWKKKGDDHHLSAFCAKSAAHDFKDPPLFMILCTMSSEFTENLPLQFIAMLQKVNVLWLRAWPLISLSKEARNESRMNWCQTHKPDMSFSAFWELFSTTSDTFYGKLHASTLAIYAIFKSVALFPHGYLKIWKSARNYTRIGHGNWFTKSITTTIIAPPLEILMNFNL